MKPHLPVMDGLRGTAALCVMVFHLQELTIGLSRPDSLWLRHAYLAVDFFFCLSGYVIGYAYDDRREEVGVAGFFKARLVRLHPLVVLGVLFGLASYVLDPFASLIQSGSGLERQNAPLWKLAVATVGGMLLLPVSSLSGRYGSILPLNEPSWSLMWEYLINIVYAIVLWRMPTRGLAILVAVSGGGLIWCAVAADTLALGFAWGQMIYGLARVSFSFCIGLLLYRRHVKVRTPLGFGFLSILLVLLFVLPPAGNSESGTVASNWAYDLVAVAVIFPLIVVLSAGAGGEGLIGRLCAFCGRISYPLYMLHYSIITLFINYNFTRGVSDAALPWTIAMLSGAAILFAWIILKWVDEPLRRKLARHILGRSSITSLGQFRSLSSAQ